MLTLLLTDNFIISKLPNYQLIVRKVIAKIINLDLKIYNDGTKKNNCNSILKQVHESIKESKNEKIINYFYSIIVVNREKYNNCLQEEKGQKTQLGNDIDEYEKQLKSGSAPAIGGSRKTKKAITNLQQNQQLNKTKRHTKIIT
jgi:hypothetical protein